MSRNLTGKQAEFIRQYLGPCQFNATQAAKAAGYRATSRHSFESIGSENLLKPEIRKAINEHFKYSRMTAQEVLQELTSLARGNSKEKLRALALLSSHFGILDGRGSEEEIQRQAELMADKRIDEYAKEIEKDVEEYNRKAEANNRDKDKQFKLIVKRYQRSREAVEALQLMFRVMKGYERVEEKPDKPSDVEIIPPERQPAPARVEKMMESFEPEIVESEPELCRHGHLPGNAT